MTTATQTQDYRYTDPYSGPVDIRAASLEAAIAASVESFAGNATEQSEWVDFAIHALDCPTVADKYDEGCTGADNGRCAPMKTYAIPAVEPSCEWGDAHVFAAPHRLLGGLKENPGVIGHGGGVKITTVCLRCGWEKTLDTWATNPATGEQGLEQTTYKPSSFDHAELQEALADLGTIHDDKIVAHFPLECRDCDTRAHQEEDGAGCWCPVCFCPNAEGGNDTGDGTLCRFCATLEEAVDPLPIPPLMVSVDPGEGGAFPIFQVYTGFPAGPIGEEWEARQEEELRAMVAPFCIDIGGVQGYVRVTLEYMGNPPGFFNPGVPGTEFPDPPITKRQVVIRHRRFERTGD